MKPESRLRSRAHFARIARDGRRVACPQLVVSFAPGAGTSPRVGFSSARRLGGAVVRNRIRRRLREAVRPLLPELPPVDIVIAPRSAAAAASTRELHEALERVLTDAGLLQRDGSLHNGGTTPD